MNSGERKIIEQDRANLGRPTEEEKGYFLNELFPAASSEQVERYRNEQYTLKVLRAVREAHIADHRSTSRVALSASLIGHRVAAGLEEFVTQFHGAKNDKYFRFFYDVHQGMKTTMRVLLLAEHEIAGEAARIAAQDLSNDPDPEIPLGEIASLYLAHRNEAKKDASLLIKDPSGFTLIDDYVHDIETNWDAATPESQEYVLAGARLAAELYKTIYQTSAKLESLN